MPLIFLDPRDDSRDLLFSPEDPPLSRLPPLLAASFTDHASPHLRGVVIQPAHIALGLKGWEDAFEGTLPSSNAPYVFFDLEKITRMMLRQSSLALETLAAPTHTRDPLFDPRALANSLITRDILHAYAHLPDARDKTSLRPLLTGALLATHAALSLSLDRLREELSDTLDLSLLSLDTPPLEALAETSARARELIASSEAKSFNLRPSGYDEANAALVRWRYRSAERDGYLATQPDDKE